MTPVETLTEIFGGKSALARAAGVDPAAVTRWGKPAEWRKARHMGNDGRVPTRHNKAIIATASAMALEMPGLEAQTFLDRVTACLDPGVCPTCGQPIDDGRVL